MQWRHFESVAERKRLSRFYCRLDRRTLCHKIVKINSASEQVLTENVSDAKNVIKEFLVFDRPAASSASSQNHHLPSKLNNLMPNPYPNQAKLNIPPPNFAPILRPHNQHLNPPPAAFNPTSKSYEVMSAIQVFPGRVEIIPKQFLVVYSKRQAAENSFISTWKSLGCATLLFIRFIVII